MTAGGGGAGGAEVKPARPSRDTTGMHRNFGPFLGEHASGLYTDRMILDPRRIETLDPVSVRALRALSAAQKWDLANRMVLEARESITHIVRAAQPAWSESQVRAEVMRRMGCGST